MEMGAIIAVDFSLRRRAPAKSKVHIAGFREVDDALIHSLRNAVFVYTHMLTWWGMWLPKPPERPKA
jgi:hypothetical protein